MSIQEMREAARGIEEVAEAIRQLNDPTRKVRLERAIRRATGEAGDRAVSAVSSAAMTSEMMLDEWAEGAGHGKTAMTLSLVAMRLKWRADIAERPDDLGDLLKDRMERGMAYMPKPLLKALYELGSAVEEVKAARKSGKEVEDTAKRLMDLAADWARRVEEARDAEAGVIVCVAPF